ncbi:MAG: triple tyrosine motif-containing protein, partial [Acidobacteriota bacterium]
EFRRVPSILPASEEGRQRLYALLYDREDTLWIATEAGLLQIVDGGAEDQPGLTIAMSLDGRAQRGASSFIVPPGIANVRFDIAAPTFRNPQALQVRARLEGLEDEWRPATGDGVADFSYDELGAGSYRLVAQASFDGETWPFERSLSLEIEPHLHETLSFWLWLSGAVFGVVAVVGGWIFFMRRRERLFAEMAAQEWREIQEESGMIDPDDDFYDQPPP